MEIDARIASYSVLKDGISLQLLCHANSATQPNMLASVQDKTGYFSIGNIRTTGIVKSVSLRKDIHLLLHLPRTSYIAKSLFVLMEGDNIHVTMHNEQQNELLQLLVKASRIRNKSPQQLLIELSSFWERKGVFVEGKDSLQGMSPRQQEVVKGKLVKILKEEGSNVSICPTLVEEPRGEPSTE